MASPLVRRLRVAAGIYELRRSTGMTSEQFARAAGRGMTRLDISRLENAARVPAVEKVMACLKAAGVDEDSETWRTLVRLAWDANEKGWWDAPEFAKVSDRQKRCANVESGTCTIRHYHNSLIPWMLQTPEYIAARDEVWREDGAELEPIHGEARLRRQAEVMREGGPQITVLLEEQVIRRPLVDAAVMARQLRHLVEVAQMDRVSIRMLTVDSTFGRHSVPLTPFDLLTYEDAEDGTAMMTSTVNDDVLIYDQKLIAPYVRLWERLRGAAMSDEDTAACIERAAARLAA